jgi:uncharacterized membrane protein
MSNNVQIAIDWVNQHIPVTQSGGHIAFPVFPGATKHDVQKMQRAFAKNKDIANVQINKRVAVLTVK